MSVFHRMTDTMNLNIQFIVQDPGSLPAKRIWTSIDTGTEIFVSDKDEVAEWSISDFDVIVTQPESLVTHIY